MSNEGWQKPEVISDEQWEKLEEWEKAEIARTWAMEPDPAAILTYYDELCQVAGMRAVPIGSEDSEGPPGAGDCPSCGLSQAICLDGVNITEPVKGLPCGGVHCPRCKGMVVWLDGVDYWVGPYWLVRAVALVENLSMIGSSILFMVGYFGHNALVLNIGVASIGMYVGLGTLLGRSRACFFWLVCAFVAMIMSRFSIPWYVGLLWPWAVLHVWAIPTGVFCLLHLRTTVPEVTAALFAAFSRPVAELYNRSDVQ